MWLFNQKYLLLIWKSEDFSQTLNLTFDLKIWYKLRKNKEIEKKKKKKPSFLFCFFFLDGRNGLP